MRGIDMFCASQAATSVRLTSINDHASSSSSTVHLGSSRLIDRHNPIITDPSRHERPQTSTKCDTTLPIAASKDILSPKASPASRDPKSSPFVPKPDTENANKTKKSKKKDENKNKNNNKNKNKNNDFVSRISCVKGGGFISPSGSTRYLLGERTGLLEVLPGLEPVVSVVPGQLDNTDKKPETGKKLDVDLSSDSKPALSSRSSDQVVVLRVLLHCKGCAGKVKKHISRMQGVKSFNIDFAAKKVTVVGDVTPLEVLASISKVKTAKLWTPPKPTSLPSTNLSAFSGINKSKTIVA